MNSFSSVDETVVGGHVMVDVAATFFLLLKSWKKGDGFFIKSVGLLFA
jgi:hypothetical protein